MNSIKRVRLISINLFALLLVILVVWLIAQDNLMLRLSAIAICLSVIAFVFFCRDENGRGEHEK